MGHPTSNRDGNGFSATDDAYSLTPTAPWHPVWQAQNNPQPNLPSDPPRSSGAVTAPPVSTSTSADAFPRTFSEPLPPPASAAERQGSLSGWLGNGADGGAFAGGAAATGRQGSLSGWLSGGADGGGAGENSAAGIDGVNAGGAAAAGRQGSLSGWLSADGGGGASGGLGVPVLAGDLLDPPGAPEFGFPGLAGASSSGYAPPPLPTAQASGAAGSGVRDLPLNCNVSIEKVFAKQDSAQYNS